METSNQEPLFQGISLVYLAYNEERNLPTTLDTALLFCKDHVKDWEIIVVNDGSTDRTREIIDDYSRQDSRVVAVHHDSNRGMGGGMKTGIQRCTKSSFIFLSSDGQSPVSALPKFFAQAQAADIILSVYEKRRPSIVREILSFGLRSYMRMVASIHFPLEGLYLFPTKLAQSIAPGIPSETFFFSFELIAKAVEQGASTKVIAMAYSNRQQGSSKVANFRRIRAVAREVSDYGRRKKRAARSTT